MKERRWINQCGIVGTEGSEWPCWACDSH